MLNNLSQTLFGKKPEFYDAKYPYNFQEVEPKINLEIRTASAKEILENFRDQHENIIETTNNEIINPKVMELTKNMENKPVPKTNLEILQTIKLDEKTDDLWLSNFQNIKKPLNVVSFTSNSDYFTVTFSQSIVNMRSPLPLTIQPEINGNISWLGSKTLKFTPYKPFEDSSKYEVVLHKDLISIHQNSLEKPFKFTISTPTPKIIQKFPSDLYTSPIPILYIEYDQEIDVKDVLNHISIVDGGIYETLKIFNFGGVKYPLNFLDVSKIQDIITDKRYSNLYHSYLDLIKNHKENKSIWITVKNPLQQGYKYQVKISAGIKSIHGNNGTESDESFSFDVYPGLKVESHQMNANTLQVVFSNPLNLNIVDSKLFTISPSMTDFQVNFSSDSRELTLVGIFTNSMKFSLELSPEIVDIFGQYLTYQELKFNVKSSSPYFYMPSHILCHDSERGSPQIFILTRSVSSIRIVINQVDPEVDFETSPLGGNFKNRNESNLLLYCSPGKNVADFVISPKGRDVLEELIIDLKDYLQHPEENLGHLLICAEPNFGDEKIRKSLWIQSTRQSIDYFSTNGIVYAWSNSMKTGSTLEDVEFCRIVDGIKLSKEITLSEGITKIDTTNEKCDKFLLVSRIDQDVSFLRIQNSTEEKSHFKIFIFNWKTVYCSSETVKLRGIIRKRVKENNIFALTNLTDEEIKFCVRDDSSVISEGNCEILKNSSFEIHFSLQDAKPGRYSLRVTIQDSTLTNYFEVLPKLPADYTFNTKMNPGPCSLNESVILSTQVKHRLINMKGTPIQWTVLSESIQFVPPGWENSQFIFSPQRNLENSTKFVKSYDGKLNSNGKHSIIISMNELPEVQSYSTKFAVQCEFTSMDHQIHSTTNSFVFHPSDYFIGMKCESKYSPKDISIPISIIVTDINGKIIDNVPIVIEVFNQKSGLLASSTIQSKTEPVIFDFKSIIGGEIIILASILDKKKRKNSSYVTIWLLDGLNIIKRPINFYKFQLKLIPDKAIYNIGDTAQILILSPFTEKSEGVIIIVTETIEIQSKFTIKSGESHGIAKIPISQHFSPNAYMMVYLTVPGTPNQPACGYGICNLIVPPKKNILRVELELDEKNLKPCSKASVSIYGYNRYDELIENGEAVLNIVNSHDGNEYFNHNLIQTFYPKRIEKKIDSSSRFYYLNNKQLISTLYSQQPRVRTVSQLPMRISMTTTFQMTDVHSKEFESSGKVVMEENLMDMYGEFKMNCLVQREKNFGISQKSFKVEPNVQLFGNFPKYLYYGDNGIDLSFSIKNNSNSNIQFKIMSKFQNLKLSSDETVETDIDKNSLRTVKFIVHTILPGSATIDILFISDEIKFERLFHREIQVYSNTLKYSHFETMDDKTWSKNIERSETIIDPKCSLIYSNSQIVYLLNPMLELTSKKHVTLTQLASEMLIYLTMSHEIQISNLTSIPNSDERNKFIQNGIEKIVLSQHGTGGWGAWTKKSPINIFSSIYICQTLYTCKKNGFNVPDDTFVSARKFLHDIEKHMADSKFIIKDPITVYSLKAYSLLALNNLGEDKEEIVKQCRNLLKKCKFDNISLEGLAWLMETMFLSSYLTDLVEFLQNVLKVLGSAIEEQNGIAHFGTSYNNDGKSIMFHSLYRTDAIILYALIVVDKNNELVEKIAKGLIEVIKNEKISSLDSYFIIKALKQYFDSFEQENISNSVNIWFDNNLIHQFSTKKSCTMVEVPLDFRNSCSQLTFEIENKIHFRIGLKCPSNEQKEILNDENFAFYVERVFEAVSPSNQLFQDEKNVWKIKKGTIVKVKLIINVLQKRYHVSLIDYLPAGLINPIQETVGIQLTNLSHDSVSNKTWFETQYFKNEKIKVFTTLLSPGVYEYCYLCEAAIVGQYLVPGVRMKEVYAPHNIGLSKMCKIQIEE